MENIGFSMFFGPSCILDFKAAFRAWNTFTVQLHQGHKVDQKTVGIQLSSSSGRSIHNVSARRTRSEGNTSCQSLEKKITSEQLQ